MTKNNDCLCRFDFTGIPPAPKGVPVIEVTFEIDHNNTPAITVAEKRDRSRKMVVTINRSKETLMIVTINCSTGTLSYCHKGTLSQEAENYKMLVHLT